MSVARERFRTVLSRPDCTLAANIFDPLSARIAHLLDYEVCFLSGSVHKVANLAVLRYNFAPTGKKTRKSIFLGMGSTAPSDGCHA